MTLTVEERIQKSFNVSVSELLAAYAKQGKTSKQVAEILQCGVSNVRRIARKYNVRFNQPTPQPSVIHSDAFLAKDLNPTNFLCRAWSPYTDSSRDSA